MLNKALIDKLLYKADIEDTSNGSVEVSDSGDSVKYFNADMSYLDIRRAVFANPVLAKKVYDSDNKGIYLNCDMFQGSSKVFYTIFIGLGVNGFGTIIEARTKRIRYFSDSGEKEFLSFESMKKFLERRTS
jgi:hypothetical protein